MKGYILACGNGPKREAQLILDAAKKQDIDLDIIDPRKITVMVKQSCDFILLEGKPVDIPDFVLSAFYNVPSYYNFACLQQLEKMGVLCINRTEVMLRTKDKLLTLQFLANNDIKVPKTILYNRFTPMNIIEKELGFPLVLKIIGGSKGSGVVLIDTPVHLENILQISNAGGLQEELLLQEMITSSRGTDLRVVIVNGKAICCAKRTTSDDGFKSNVSTGGSITSYKLDNEIIEIAEKTAKALDLFVGGIDLLFSDDGYVVCEANSMPGFLVKDYKKVWGMDPPSVIMESIKNELT
ncbi:RimK family alpha-L-glutamate ligase [bacterium]|nr:RimK family alpha-L-glutamate ligase [bacterium]